MLTVQVCGLGGYAVLLVCAPAADHSRLARCLEVRDAPAGWGACHTATTPTKLQVLLVGGSLDHP